MSNHNHPGRKSVHLPFDVIPSRYNLTLVPDLDASNFQGYVEITLSVVAKTQSITLHSADLTFPHPELIFLSHVPSDVKDAKSLKNRRACTGLSLDLEEQRLSLTFGGEGVEPGTYILAIPFHGILNDKLAGFYRSQYTAADGKKKYLACTQFEACDARRCLPCFDEPAYKAIFDVTLIVQRGLTCVSNMPVLTRSTTTATRSHGHCHGTDHALNYQAGLVQYHFAESPLMSTYLLAFVVGEFDYLSARSKDGVEVRVYTPQGKTHLGHFSLDVAVKALDFYNDYFGIPYPLPKMDLLAIPDFAAGAMENWGCITYRDTRLLIDPEHSSVATKQATAKTISHEIAHMWFGNLVTMKWWNNLWLNEGFATWMEDAATHKLFPQWNIWTKFVAQVQSSALSLDSMETSHPVEVKVDTREEINEIFDTISYAKGASVIRMLHDQLGPEVFMNGMRQYLQKHKYRNTVTDDLWQALGAAAGRDVVGMMSKWVQRTGYPVIVVEETTPAENKDDKRTFKVRQERYLASGKEAKGDEALTWTIPLFVGTVATSKEAGGKDVQQIVHVLEKDSAEITVPCPAGQAVTFNHLQSGFYRVQYTTKMYSELAAAISAGTLPPVDRLGLVGDIMALSRANRIPVTQVLDFIKCFTHEDDVDVLTTLASQLAGVHSLHQQESYAPQIQKLILNVFTPLFQRVGFGQAGVKEDESVTQLRATVLSMMSRGGDKTVQDEARKRFTAFVEDQKANPISADIRSTIYGLAAKLGGQQAFDSLLAMYRKSEFTEEKQRILGALGKVRDSALISRVLDLAFSPEVRKGEVIYVFASMADSPAGRAAAWQHLQTHWEAWMTKFKDAGFLLGHLIDYALSDFTETADADQVEKFFTEHPVAAAERTVKQCLESIRLRAARLQIQRPQLTAYFAQNA